MQISLTFLLFGLFAVFANASFVRFINDYQAPLGIQADNILINQLNYAGVSPFTSVANSTTTFAFKVFLANSSSTVLMQQAIPIIGTNSYFSIVLMNDTSGNLTILTFVQSINATSNSTQAQAFSYIQLINLIPQVSIDLFPIPSALGSSENISTDAIFTGFGFQSNSLYELFRPETVSGFRLNLDQAPSINVTSNFKAGFIYSLVAFPNCTNVDCNPNTNSNISQNNFVVVSEDSLTPVNTTTNSTATTSGTTTRMTSGGFATTGSIFTSTSSSSSGAPEGSSSTGERSSPADKVSINAMLITFVAMVTSLVF